MSEQLTRHKLRNFLFIGLAVILFFIVFAPFETHASHFRQNITEFDISATKTWDSDTSPEPVDIKMSYPASFDLSYSTSNTETDITFPDTIQVYYGGEKCGTAVKSGSLITSGGFTTHYYQPYSVVLEIPLHFSSYSTTSKSETIHLFPDLFTTSFHGDGYTLNTSNFFDDLDTVENSTFSESSASGTPYHLKVTRDRSSTKEVIEEESGISIVTTNKINFTLTNSSIPHSPPAPVIIPKGSLELTAAKTVNNETPDQSFTFCLLDSDGNILQTKQNDPDGTIRFDPIHYGSDDIGKEFTYQVIEQSGSDENMTYDSSVYTVNVKPHQDPDDPSKIIAEPTITKDGQEVSSITFNNIAGPSEWYGTLDLSGLVLLDGTPASKPFLFELKDEDGTVLDTVHNSHSGIFTFAPIEYDQNDAGNTYTYTVTQVNTGKNVVHYDESVYTVTVRVDKSDQDGVLNLQKKIKSAGPVSETASVRQTSLLHQTASVSQTAPDRQNQIGALNLQQEILKDGEPADRIVYENTSVKTTHKDTPKPAAQARSPKTGDHASPILWFIILIAAAAGLRIVLRKDIRSGFH